MAAPKEITADIGGSPICAAVKWNTAAIGRFCRLRETPQYLSES
jgi:hypothetical protein